MITVYPHQVIPYPIHRVPPKCPYCARRSELVDSVAVYGRSYGPIWLCAHCEALVGCHKNSPDFAPLGRLADAGLRKLKTEVHALLDPYWRETKGGSQAFRRKAIYRLLGDELGIKPCRCHVGDMDDAMCERVLDLLHSARWRVLAAGAITHTANET